MTLVPVPRRRRRWWRCLAWALVIVVPGVVSGADPAIPALLKPLGLVAYPPRTTPPDFGGPTLEAGHFSMTALGGSVVLVNFWASWCLGCRPEMPVLERLHRELAPQGLAVVGVNTREKKATVSRYAKELALTFPLVLDSDGTISALYGVVGLPATFLIGRDGRAVGFAIGAREWKSPQARALFQALLAEPAPRPGAE